MNLASKTRQWPRATEILRGRGQHGRAPEATAQPLYRSGYALLINTVGTTAIGVVYWAVAAHLYNRQALGRSSAMISALILVSSIAQLNLNNTLPRFLPLAGRRSGRLIGYCYGASSLTALIAGLAFIIIMPNLGGQWRFLDQLPLLAPAFAIATIVWGVFALEDAALTGLRRAVVVPVENTIYGVVKLLALLGLAWLLPATGIFISWLIPLLLIVPGVNWLIFRRYLRIDEFATTVATVRPRAVIRFAGVDYVGALLGQFCSNMLPLIVLTKLGAATNGIFYVAWTITFGLALVGANFATSMLVEGAAAPHRLAELTRGVLTRCALIIAPCVALLIVAARPILTVYGAQYADRATRLLGLLAIAVVPRTFVLVTFSLDRLAGRVGRATMTSLILTILVLGGSWLMLTRIGVDGVALAWGGGNLVIAVVRLPTILGAMRTARSRHRKSTEPTSGSLLAWLLSMWANLRVRQEIPLLVQRRPPGRHRSSMDNFPELRARAVELSSPARYRRRQRAGRAAPS